MSEITLIRPEIFSEIEAAEAVFTTANRTVVNPNGTISGLNLGNNTSASDSEITINKKHLFRELGWNMNHLASAKQVHGTNIQIVDEPGFYPDCDGLITQKQGIVLSIQVADCAAILIAANNGKLVGAFHAGWRGAASGIVKKGIQKMKSINPDVMSYRAFISPCISQKHFEVGEEVAQFFPDKYVDRKSYTKPHVDLKSTIINELLTEGLNKQNIQHTDQCTFENHNLYSYRRERDKAGRMLAMITINKT